MNIDFSETYDQESDTHYATFKTGEPSYCIEVDDVILLELGMFSNLPTGFRILNFARNKVKRLGLKVLIKDLQDSLRSVPPPRSEEHGLKPFRNVGQAPAKYWELFRRSKISLPRVAPLVA